MSNTAKYYDELFGASDDEDEAPPPPPQQQPQPPQQRQQAPASRDDDDDGSSSDDSAPKQFKRVAKGGKKTAPARVVRRNDSDDSDDDDDEDVPRPTTGYEEEEHVDRGMDDSDDGEYREDEEEEERKPKKGKGKAKGLKASSSRGSRGENEGVNDRARNLIDGAASQFKKPKAKDPDDNQIKEICEDVVNTFERALKDDKVAMERGQPATNKLRAIEGLLRLMGNRKVQDALMEKHHLLTHIKGWIKPMERTKELPLHTVRSKLIEFLLQVPVEVDQLKESGIGKVIQQLYKHKDETYPNKQMLKRIIDRWSNQIMRKSQTYRNQVIDEEEEEENRRRGGGATNDPTYFEAHTARGVKISRRTGFSFKTIVTSREGSGVKPVHIKGAAPRRDDEAEEVMERGDGDGGVDQDSKKAQLKRKMSELLKKPSSKKLRAANVSTN